MSLIELNNEYFITGGAEIAYPDLSISDDISSPKHTHHFIEMAYMLKGQCLHIIDDTEYPVRHGDLVIINYGQTHSIKADASSYFVNILMKPEYINKELTAEENAFALLHLSEFEDFRKILDRNVQKVTFSGKERDQIEELILGINNEVSEKNPGYELAIRLRFNMLLIMVFRKMSLKLTDARFDISDTLLEYIKSHCQEKLTLDTLAKKCSYNTSYFSRAFKKYTGTTFTEYLKKVRIEKAKSLLINTDLSVTDIVYESGYTDQTNFFAHFKSLVGETPLKYRKTHKKSLS